MLGVLTLLACLGLPAQATETLYNGIVLPTGFPSNDANYNAAVDYAINNHLCQALPPWMQSRPSVIPINVGRQFFIPVTSNNVVNNPDSTQREFLVDSLSNITRTYHYGTYYNTTTGMLNPTTNPCLTFSDGVWWDPNVNKYVLYTHLQTTDANGNLYAIGKYYSDDGISWTLFNNNVTLQDNAISGNPLTIADCDSDAIWLDQGEQNPAKRWKAFFMWKGENSGCAAVSPDGNAFANGVNLGNVGNQDRTTIFINPFRNPRVGVWSIRGGVAGADRMRDYLERDPNIFCTTAEGGWPGYTPEWTGADILDPNSHLVSYLPTLYNLDCTPYESMMLGMFSVHMQTRDDGTSENRTDKINQVHLGFSYDGWYFHRPVDANGKHVALCPVIPAPGTACDPNNPSLGWFKRPERHRQPAHRRRLRQ